MMRLIRTLMGKSHREAAAAEELEQHRAEHAVAMEAVAMKVAAMEIGAERMVRECRKTEEAAAELLARLREDFPK